MFIVIVLLGCAAMFFGTAGTAVVVGWLVPVSTVGAVAAGIVGGLVTVATAMRLFKVILWQS